MTLFLQDEWWHVREILSLYKITMKIKRLTFIWVTYKINIYIISSYWTRLNKILWLVQDKQQFFID